ncbi:hypothetical protein CDAR_214111 [Caerostris darwini]|uniref:Uncharacterized protein n=1 Tax=Caerostris darwini TaxID=1538125 RepID=A0AAV4SFR0_9ARAC|nr:hypothetical protein CDAR_214111 [Caerostris darwini]
MNSTTSKMMKFLGLFVLVALVAMATAHDLEEFLNLFSDVACTKLYTTSGFNRAMKLCGTCIEVTVDAAQTSPIKCGSECLLVQNIFAIPTVSPKLEKIIHEIE